MSNHANVDFTLFSDTEIKALKTHLRSKKSNPICEAQLCEVYDVYHRHLDEKEYVFDKINHSLVDFSKFSDDDIKWLKRHPCLLPECRAKKCWVYIKYRWILADEGLIKVTENLDSEIILLGSVLAKD